MEKVIGIKVDEVLFEAIRKRCKRDRLSNSGLIRMVLVQELKEELESLEASK